jgi:hypothetical protein
LCMEREVVRDDKLFFHISLNSYFSLTIREQIAPMQGYQIESISLTFLPSDITTTKPTSKACQPIQPLDCSLPPRIHASHPPQHPQPKFYQTKNAPPQTHSHNPNLRRPLRLRRPPSARSSPRSSSSGTSASAITNSRTGAAGTSDAAEDAKC